MTSSITGADGPNKDKPQVPVASSRQIFISLAIILCQFVQMIPYGAGINSALAIGEQLGVTPGESAWIIAAYP